MREQRGNRKGQIESEIRAVKDDEDDDSHDDDDGDDADTACAEVSSRLAADVDYKDIKIDKTGAGVE